MLLISAILMIFFGWFIAKKSTFKDKKVMDQKRKLYMFGMIFPAAVLLIFAIISMFSMGLSVEKDTVAAINAKDLFYDCRYDKAVAMGYSQNSVAVMNITIKNDFILPRKVMFNSYTVCAEPSNYYLGFDVSDDEQSYMNNQNGVEINPYSTKTVIGSIQKTCAIENISISKIYIIDTKDSNRNMYLDCSRLTNKQKADAIVIDVVN
jgi:hypothetical protein